MLSRCLLVHRDDSNYLYRGDVDLNAPDLTRWHDRQACGGARVRGCGRAGHEEREGGAWSLSLSLSLSLPLSCLRTSEGCRAARGRGSLPSGLTRPASVPLGQVSVAGLHTRVAARARTGGGPSPARGDVPLLPQYGALPEVTSSRRYFQPLVFYPERRSFTALK
jgi:hypothetical protein